MKKEQIENRTDRLIAGLSGMWEDEQDRARIAKTIQALDTRYDLEQKLAREPGVAEIIAQMTGRLARSYARLADLQGKRILDIACGSNTSKLPASLHLKTPLGELSVGGSKGYTALFEPWFCRILFELGATPVGVDFGDLEEEAFTHYKVDLGKTGAMDFLPEASFDAIQDSRLFGSPEFTAEFPKESDRLKVAHEIVKQEQRLLKPGGIIIHSDAAAW
jgi:SAM-dependent methyltransferase